jgi:hypothetical protein
MSWKKINLIKDVLAKIPPVIPITPEKTRDQLEILKGKERLRIDAIDELQEKLEELRKIRATGGGFSFGGLVNTTRYADLSAQCDGSNKTFTVPRHRKAVILTGTDFPIIYRPTTDYTTANLTLTLTSEVGAPSLGATLIFQYIK